MPDLGEELSEEVKKARAAVVHDIEHPGEVEDDVQSSKAVSTPDISPALKPEVERAKKLVAKDIETGMAAKGPEEEK